MPKFGHFGLIWSYGAEIWYVWVFLGADYEYELRMSIHAQLDTKISLLLRFYVIFGKGRSHKMVVMVTRKRLSLNFFFQSVDYVPIRKVTKFQEKKSFRSSVILEKPLWGWNPKKKNLVDLDDLYYTSLVDTLEEKH